MEERIKIELDKKYKNIKIEILFVDFRKYEIFGTIENLGEFHFEYEYNANYTFDYNMTIICYNIEKQIVQLFRR